MPQVQAAQSLPTPQNPGAAATHILVVRQSDLRGFILALGALATTPLGFRFNNPSAFSRSARPGGKKKKKKKKERWRSRDPLLKIR